MTLTPRSKIRRELVEVSPSGFRRDVETMRVKLGILNRQLASHQPSHPKRVFDYAVKISFHPKQT
jgi:hypothetical protein